MTNLDNRVVALLLLLATGCGEQAPGEEPAARGWQRVGDGLPGALISIAGTSTDDVWAAGGDPGDGSGALVVHFDGRSWSRRSPDVAADLWWVHPFADGSAMFGGSQGTILRYRDGSFETLPTPTQATVFGIWGATAQDVWAVGGLPSTPGNAFVWRYDGNSWQAASGVPAIPVNSYFKVWGRASDDVRIVGADGVILHFDGQTFTRVDSKTNRRLLTLHAEPGGRWAAVGGQQSAVVLEDDGLGWRDVTPPETRAMVGVRLSGEAGYAVGTAGAVIRRSAQGWREELLPFDVYQDFHAVWIDPDGGVWAVGGDILASPMLNGVLLHKGNPIPELL